MRGVLVFLLLVMCAQDAGAACLIGPKPIEQEYIKSEVVVLAEPLESRDYSDRSVKIKEIFKDEKGLLKVGDVIWTTNGGSSPGSVAIKGYNEHIIYGRYRDEDTIVYSFCGITKPHLSSFDAFKKKYRTEDAPGGSVVFEGKVLEVEHKALRPESEFPDISEIKFYNQQADQSVEVLAAGCGADYRVGDRYYFTAVKRENEDTDLEYRIQCKLEGVYLVDEVEKLRSFRDAAIHDPFED